MKGFVLGAMVEMVGEDKLVFDVSNDPSAIACLQGGAEVMASRIVLKSKNGRVAKISVNQLSTIKQEVLKLFRQSAADHFTKSGLEMALNTSGAIRLGHDIYWIKGETDVIPREPLPISGEIPFQLESVLLLARSK